MAQYSDSSTRPVNRNYRLLMEKAISARNLGNMDAYHSLLTEADRLLKRIRQSSSLQLEGQNAQHSPEQNKQYQ